MIDRMPAPARRLSVLLCMAALAVCPSALAQKEVVSRPGAWMSQHYTTRNGLPQNSVIALAMDSVGFLWITTEGGLVRCDGERFTHVPVSNAGARGPERMRRLIPSLEGDLYTDDSRGQLYLIHGHSRVFPVPCDLISGLAVTGGVPGFDLLLKVADRHDPLQGRDRWPNDRLNILPLDLHDWLVQCPGLLLAYHDSSLVDSIVLPEACSPLFLSKGHVVGISKTGEAFRVDLAARATRAVAITGHGHQARPFRSQEYQIFWRAGEPRAFLRQEQDLYLLAATDDGDSIRVQRMDLDLPRGCSITSVLLSEEHRMLALGTNTKGLFIYHPRYMRAVPEKMDGSDGGPFYAQVTWPGGKVLAATNQDRVMMFGPDGSVLEPAPIPVFSYEGVFHDTDGTIWYSPKLGLKRYDPATGKDAWVIPAGEHNCFTRFLREGDSLWTTDQSGIHCWYNDTLRTVHRNPDKLAFRRAQFLRRRDREQLWFGTCDGLYSLRTWTGEVDTIRAFQGHCVRAMERIRGRWYVGTYASGAFVETKDGFRVLPQDVHGFLSHVHAFMEDKAGGLWMSTNRGLFRVRSEELDRFLSDTTWTLHYDYFGEWSGIGNSEFNGGCDPAFVRMSDGTASFPTLEGLVWFKPEEVPGMWPSAPVLIEDLVVDGAIWPVNEYPVFEPGTRAIEVRFALPYWGDPGNVHLEYWLKGRPGTWALLDEGKRSLRFRDLPPGEYELLVRKAGSTDLSGVGQIWFNVRRPFYQRTWARVLFLLLSVAAVWALVRLNAMRLHRKNRRLEEHVLERTRELEQANRELKRSMELKHRLVSIISHDIVAPLRFIARVARGGARPDAFKDPAELSDTLRDISFSAEKLYANARNTLSWIRSQEGGSELRPMHVALNPLVEEVFDVGRSLAQSKGLRLLNEVSLDDVVRTDRDVLSIILHNLITNAITHTEQGEVRVGGKQDDGIYSITVEDTGHGMCPQALAYIRSLRAGDRAAQGSPDEDVVHGLGYVIIIELVRTLGASLDVDSSPGTGTRVSVRLRIQE